VAYFHLDGQVPLFYFSPTKRSYFNQTLFIAGLSICGPTFSLCSVLPLKSWKVYKLLLSVKVLEELFER